jgi:hypothetical protein
MEHVCHIVICTIYIILCYAIGTGIDSLLYIVRSDRNKKILVGISSVVLLIGYLVSIYVLIYFIYNVLA